MKKYLFTGLAVFLAFLFLPVKTVYAFPRVQPVDGKIVIVIDPGHGGENKGTLGTGVHMENGAPEKEMALVTAQAMYEELSLYDNVEVYLTRTDDRDLSLKERAQFAADVSADFLFSIHYNASEKHNLFGTEVWIPSTPPYNAYGYQFGCVQMETMADMGLFLRGVKTRLSEKASDSDYYGIIREAINLSVPSAIIEHCHVDEERDIIFCDTEEKWKEFGRADALSVAKYFGLKSTSLGVDYSEDAESLPEASPNAVVKSTLKDWTPPDICQVEVQEADYDTGELALTVSAADYDSPLIYYDYSIDGGETYSSLQAWPESDALRGSYADTFTLRLQIPSGIMPSVIVRAYNLFDVPAESNLQQSLGMFRYGEETETAQEASSTDALSTEALSTEAADSHEQEDWETIVVNPVKDADAQDKHVSFFTFLKLCLLFVVFLFFFVLIFQFLTWRRRRRRRHRRRQNMERAQNAGRQSVQHQARKVPGERTNHRR